MYNDRRPHPLVSIPPGAQQPINPSPSARTFPDHSYTFEVTPPAYNDVSNPWEEPHTPQQEQPPTRTRIQSMYSSYSSNNSSSSRPPSRSTSASVTRPSITFPEPQIYRSSSARPTISPQTPLGHRPSRSDVGHGGDPLRMRRDPSVASFATVSSYANGDDDQSYSGNDSYDHGMEEVNRGLEKISLDSEEGLRAFQLGQLPEKDQEWHRLVPPEAREALGNQEVQRQSVIFEVVKAEREYVADLEAVQDVFIEKLRTSKPPIIRENILPGFINEVFGNLDQILAYHKRMLELLFARQREQHPLIQSVADIVLDITLKSEFRSAYETYIKHYPLAESHHRKELKRNQAYETFIHSVSTDPRIRKRDLTTFLSRPVTRLPRLNLLLEQILKLTDKEYDHPDLEALPIILGILSDCIKSTQPGIEAAESKVKFWALCESLVFQKGEIIDMDLYDESRTLVYSGPVIRKIRTETGLSSTWSNLFGALLDNHFILAREANYSNGVVKRHLTSRPIPLSYLRLGAFNSPPETRRERADDGGLLESLRYQNVPLYPFTIYHASSRSTRRYTLYVTTESLRKRWHTALVDAMGVHKVREDANMWFYPNTVSDGFFRMAGRHTTSSTITSRLPGRITSAVPFYSGGKKFIVVASSSGIYASLWGNDEFRKVLHYSNPHSIIALQTLGDKVFNKFIVHSESALVSYSLDIIARMALGQAQPHALDASMERIGGRDSNIVFCKHVQLDKRALLIYASKRRLGSTLNLQVLEAVDSSKMDITPKRTSVGGPLSFRPFGEPGFIPKDAYDVTVLNKTVGICTHDGIVIADPTNLANSTVNLVPDLHQAVSNMPMAALKAKIEGAKPLGLVKLVDELLVVYDALGCYIEKYGTPKRNSGYIRWETTATSYTHRGGNILLLSPEFIEVRNIITGRIVQVIEGQDIRLLHAGPTGSSTDPILVAMKGSKDDKDGVSDKIVELTETSEITARTPSSAVSGALWDDWDM
ncbi:hypothetical protein BDQ12DRAFT_680852 [Crucibulum laeve]|uniref:CNH domain-containing protein n=1 Tax=Crucibulum laeve TaxID=68775 RepID=A0A5C3M7I1_9AGAR|nr:hypothetical protein BDQ12DRAFT_680852 [Crucibulum laeve]